MRAPQHETITLQQPAGDVFDAALGVMQQAKNVRILAVHNGGRKLVGRERSKMSNPKFLQVWLDEDGGGTQMHVVVGTDPRSPKAMLDGRANGKSLGRYVEAVRGALDGSAPAPATPVADHYVQKKDEVPWTDPDQDPEIELDGNFVAMYGL